jgi:NAD(P)-dependent dehydrogenase (short-subunit alcohol dehydrogenase family)
MTLNGRTALITGGGRGIGRAIALALAEDGADVALTYRRDENAARQTADQINELGRRSMVIAGAMEDFDDVRAMAATAIAELGPIAILVHNAGIASSGRKVVDTDPAELEQVVRAHALGAHVLSAAIIPSMRSRPRGDIVFISSAATRRNLSMGAPYNMAKAAMEALAFTLSKEEREHGTRVNIVAPGLVKTEMGHRLVKASGEDIESMDAAMPYGRVCLPEDIAGVVRWLVSDGAAYVNGERIYVDGGIS